MSLTGKREKFAQAIADGKTQSDAYRAAYSCDGWKAETIHVNASKLMADAKVALRVDELRAKLEEKALWSREESVTTLKTLISRKSIDPATGAEVGAMDKDVIAAVKELNAMHGYHAPTKLDVTVNPAEELAALQAARKAARGKS